MIQPPNEFASERLLLRRLADSDSTDILEYTSDPRVTKLMDWPTHLELNESLEFISRTVAEWDDGTQYSRAITRRHEPGVVGAISCSETSHKVSFGYTLAHRYWGKGYATEASKEIVNWLSSLPEVQRIWAVCDIDNIASAKVLEKSGLSKAGILKTWEVRPNLPGEPIRDVYVFAKIRDA